MFGYYKPETTKSPNVGKLGLPTRWIDQYVGNRTRIARVTCR